MRVYKPDMKICLHSKLFVSPFPENISRLRHWSTSPSSRVISHRHLNVMDNVPCQAESCVVEAEALQSAISRHHEKRATLVVFPHGDKGPERRRELRQAKEDYINGRMTHAEFYAVMDRFQAESDADHQRLLDFKAREEAGHAKPRDFFVSYYGWTEAEADEYFREGTQEYNAREANEARARTRILQNGKHTRGH